MPWADPEVRKQKRRPYDRAYKKMQRDKVAAIKMEMGCIDCGYKEHPAALDFDHISGDKSEAVGTMLRGLGWKRIEEEIAKCVVRCSNCHRVRHAKERDRTQ